MMNGSIEENTGYNDAGKTARTDIVALCTGICGVNLSVGYGNEHRADEYLLVQGWLDTYSAVKRLLEKEQSSFPLQTA